MTTDGLESVLEKYGPAALEDLLVHRAVRRFLHRESQLLDDHDLEAWVDLLAEDVTYEVPVRSTREQAHQDDSFSESAFHLKEDWTSLSNRVKRIATEFAWAENPPTRTRHFVSNVRVPETDPAGAELPVRSNVLVYRNRSDSNSRDLLSGERHDTLRWVDDGFELAERTVLLDDVQLDRDLSIFI